jgi:hypothetical protein
MPLGLLLNDHSKLCCFASSTQLSQQHSYDWRMRAMKVVVGSAARAKLRNFDEHEGAQIIASVLVCTAPRLVSAMSGMTTVGRQL